MDYTIYNRRTNADGFDEVRLRDLNWFEERNNPTKYSLIEIIDYEDKLIEEIQKSYPHENKPDENILRKSIRTIVLRSVLGELNQNLFYFCFLLKP